MTTAYNWEDRAEVFPYLEKVTNVTTTAITANGNKISIPNKILNGKLLLKLSVLNKENTEIVTLIHTTIINGKEILLHKDSAYYLSTKKNQSANSGGGGGNSAVTDIYKIAKENGFKGDELEFLNAILADKDTDSWNELQDIPTNIGYIDSEHQSNDGNVYTKEQIEEKLRTKVAFPTRYATPAGSFLGLAGQQFLVGYEEDPNTIPGQDEPFYNPVRFSLDSIGKNLGNSNLTTTATRTFTQAHNYTHDTAGFYYYLKGLPDKSTDVTFDKILVEDGNGLVGLSDGKTMFKNLPNLLTDSEKTAWRTAMNGGWTTYSMIVLFINPMVIKNKDEMQFVSILGTNLNFNPRNFKIEIVTADSDSSNVTVIKRIPNNKVQLFNHQSLGFWINTIQDNIPEGEYKLRLTNGVAQLVTAVTFKVVAPDGVAPLDFTMSQGVLLASGTSNIQQVNSAVDILLSSDENIKPLEDIQGKNIVAQVATDAVLKGNENWSFKVTIRNDEVPNKGLTESYFGLSSSDSVDKIIQSLDFEFYYSKLGWSQPNTIMGQKLSLRNAEDAMIIFTKYQNRLNIAIISADERYTATTSVSINTDKDYRFVFGRNNGSTRRTSSYIITEAYKF